MQSVNTQQVTKVGTNLNILKELILKTDLDIFFVILSMYYTETAIMYVIVVKVVTC